MELVLEKEAALKRKLGERNFGQKTLLNRENIKALVETSNSNPFTDFRSSSEIMAKVRVKTIISLFDSLARQTKMAVPRMG